MEAYLGALMAHPPDNLVGRYVHVRAVVEFPWPPLDMLLRSVLLESPTVA